MSEPLSSTEIEDVLSSIRRLVSDDMRPAPKLAVAAGDKLILTPALRVVQTEAELPDPVPAPEAEPVPMFVAVPRSNLMDAPLDTPRGGLGGVVASVGAAVDASPDDWEAETGDSAPQPDMAPDIGLTNPWSLPADDVLDDVLPDEAGAAPHDHFEYHAAAAAASAQTPAWAQADEIGQDDEAEAATAPLHGTVEPDPVWADAAEASVLAALAEPDTADDDDAFDQAMRFDEDVLRELVRDMLREELAGKMGERITRNIRKLVRAEIARALAAQEFE